MEVADQQRAAAASCRCSKAATICEGLSQSVAAHVTALMRG